MYESRRTFIRTVAVACGGLLSEEALAASLSSYIRKREPSFNRGQFLSVSEMKLVAALVDIIIPRTDTPGALAADTHGYIDDQLAHCVAPEEAKKFLKGLLHFEKKVLDKKKVGYTELNVGEKIELLDALSEGRRPFRKKHIKFFRKIKNMTLMGYYTSEAGASIELAYLPIPGGYDADFKVSQIKKSWAN